MNKTLEKVKDLTRDLPQKIMCSVGMHNKQQMILAARTSEGREINLYYSVCIHCSAGDPRLTGEF